MASYIELAASRGARTGQMFGKAADAILGVEDAEAAVERVLMNGDWTTEEGKAKMLAEVGAIDPEAHGELQKQMLEAEQTKEATSNVKMDTENKLIGHKVKLNTGIYTRDWERLAGAGGMEFEIQYFLAQNEIDFDPKKARTVGQARDAITRHLGKKNDSSMLSSLDSFLGGRLQTYINMRAAQDASAELGVTIDTSTEPNKFDTPRVDTDTNTKTKGAFNPETASKNVTHKGEKDGVIGTWKWEETEWIGGIDGYEKKEGWKFTPSYSGAYTQEGVKFSVEGVPITADEMFANFDY